MFLISQFKVGAPFLWHTFVLCRSAKKLNQAFPRLLLAVMFTSSFALIPARALQWPGYDLYNPQSTLHSGWPNVHPFVGQCNFSAITNEAAPPHALWWPNVYTSTCTVNFSLQNLCLNALIVTVQHLRMDFKDSKLPKTSRGIRHHLLSDQISIPYTTFWLRHCKH